MGWETRERGGRYYTRSRKVGGQVVREYVGGGLVGELAAANDAARRERVAAEGAALRRERERTAGPEALLAALAATADALAGAALAAAGYRRHHRGEWRMRRGKQDDG